MTGFRLEGGLDLAPIKLAGKVGSARGLFIGAEHVLGKSNSQVPHEEGDLERSGVASVDEEGLQAAVSYDTEYAVDQHESEEYEHDAGRSAKFLENALNSENETVAQIIATSVRTELGT